MLCGVMQAPVSGQHGPSAEPAADVRPNLEALPALVATDTAALQPKAALPAPEPFAKNPAAANTARDRYMPAFTGAR